MHLIDKINKTTELLNKLDNAMSKDVNYSIVKKLLISVSDDLSNYKGIETKKNEFQNDEINSKLENILHKINEIEKNVRNKIIITDKYNSYLKS